MPSYLGTATSQGTMLTLAGRPGDWCKRSDLGTVWMLVGAVPNLIGSWSEMGLYPLSGSATLDFPSIAGGGTAELTITVTGAAAGDAVVLGPPAALEAGLAATGRVSAADTVTVRMHNTTGGAVNPGSATWKARIVK